MDPIIPGKVNIYGKKSGYFMCYDSDHEVVSNEVLLLLTVLNLPPTPKTCVHYGRLIHAALNPVGTKLVTGDHYGAAYYFDIEKNRFTVVCQLKHCCTAITVSDDTKNDIFIGSSSGSFQVFSSGVSECIKVAEFNDHTSSIFHISLDGECTRALVCSEELAALYCLKSFTKLRCLKNIKRISLLKAFFIPVTDYIVSSYRDGSIFIWDSSTLDCIYEQNGVNDMNLAIRSIDASLDGRYLAAGGGAKIIQIWHLRYSTLSTYAHLFHMTVKQVIFMPYNENSTKHFLGILGCNGSFFVYSVEDKMILYSMIPRDDMLIGLTLAVKGINMAGVTANGCVKFYNIGALCQSESSREQRSKKVMVNVPYHAPVQPPPASTAINVSPPPKTAKKKVNFAQLLKSFPKFDELAMKELSLFLRNHGEFPKKYRFTIWQKLLQIPENKDAFPLLLKKAAASENAVFPSYPLQDKEVGRALKKVLACLVTWWSPLQLLDYLPSFAFPFVKLFHSDLRLCFEILATLISNWCGSWFSDLPKPPVSVLTKIDRLLEQHEPALFHHYRRINASNEAYSWTLMQTAFSDVFIKEDWLVIWDNIISNPPVYFLCVIVAYNILCKDQILHLSSEDEVWQFFESQNETSTVRDIVSEAYRLMDLECDNDELQEFYVPLHPLSKDGYDTIHDISVHLADKKRCPCDGIHPSPQFIDTSPNHVEEEKEAAARDADQRSSSSSEKDVHEPSTAIQQGDNNNRIMNPISEDVMKLLSETSPIHGDDIPDPMQVIRDVLHKRSILASQHDVQPFSN